jgi:AraC family transcriptional regulator of adaptative response / DNA-3-methyladenine glycosylase II
MPMNQIAIASGFGCVRRFNATIFGTYRRTPSQIRRLARVKDVQPENQYVFRLRFRPPYNWGGMLEFLALRSTPGVEIVSNDCYCRSISLNGNFGWFEVSLDENEPALVARVHFSDPRSLFVIIERVRRMFDLNADWDAIVATLRTDPILASAVKAKPGMRLPGCWDPFELAVRAILGQQVSVKGATTLAGRIARAFGEPLDSINGLTHLFPTAEALIKADFSSIGLPKARAESIRALAMAVHRGEIRFDGVLDSETFIGHLMRVPGIGNWTAQYVAMRALGDPDAFPSGDIALLRNSGVVTAKDLDTRAEAWRPWRAYATIHLWSIAGATRVRANKSERVDIQKVLTQKPSVTNSLRAS